jgi:hypothetical protein
MIRRYRYVNVDLDAARVHAEAHGATVEEWDGGLDVLVDTATEAWRAYDSTLPVAPDTVGPDEAIGPPPEAGAVSSAHWSAIVGAVERGDGDALIVAVADAAQRKDGLSDELVAKLAGIKDEAARGLARDVLERHESEGRK